MGAVDWLLGPHVSDSEEHEHRIGLAAGVPVLGLDALSSAAYGPEAALTLLLPLGALGLRYIAPISALIVGILLVVYFSYRQTIAAYPGGGGSYTVAQGEPRAAAALVAGAALALDYVLNVAVGISAGVGALVSAIPALLPHTLALCLGILALLDARQPARRARVGRSRSCCRPTRSSQRSVVVIVVGIGKAIAAGGHPAAVSAPPSLPPATQAVGAWILLRAFASGCTAMTGVEAVSNGVPIFRQADGPHRAADADRDHR